MNERNVAIPAVYIILERDGKILMLRRCNTGYQDGNYQMPAGHIEAGELPTEAMIREAKEEVGIDIAPEDLELVHVSYRTKHDNTADRLDFLFRARTWSGEIVNREPDKCDELLWIECANLPKNTVPHIPPILEYVERGIGFSEFGKDLLKAQGVYDL